MRGSSLTWPTLRLSLLLLVLSPICSSWSLLGFGQPQTKQIYLHPSSAVEASAETLRIKRQAYQVNIDGDVTVTVDQTGGGLIETGAWGPWHRDGQCSRTCGGGVYKEKRECNGECTGASVRYHSCNLDECPDDAIDFRAQQCSDQNDKPFDGKYYNWTPYAGANKCELTCKPDSEDFYYKWADKVVDGTKCDKVSNDICVDGICLPLGCDGKLGSTSKADKCGVCNGNGTTCKSQEGVIKESALSAGYNNVVVLPIGATSITIEENRPTSNSLAIKNASGTYFLNGNHQIVLSNQNVVAGGTVFKYQKAKVDGSLAERLTAAGPLKEELTVQLLFQRAPHGSTVKFSYSTPLDEDVQFIYKPGEWSQCSVSCGKGVQTRSVFCTDTTNQQRVDDEVCDDNNSTKPLLEKSCQTVDCEAEWFEGKWEDCSESCGNHGWQYRVVYCHKVFANGKRMTVDDGNCTVAQRPAVKQTCNRFSCPEWHAGPWSACSEKCGDAKQYRSVTCRSEKGGEEGKLLPASDCPADIELEHERYCNLGPCDGLTFSTTDWDLCEKCNDTTETRNVTCKDQTGRVYPLEKCLNEEVTEIPQDSRVCATQPPCTYEWHVSEWSKCSTECGHGHKNRKVHCAINELGSIKIVDESLCVAQKPETKENCTNEEKCTGTYYSGPWTNCTAECGGGKQSRLIVCLNYDKKPVPEWCDEAARPAEEQECNVDPCPTCENSTFGCCPDNSTFAQGEWYDGCSNCSLSEFGCCANNLTSAAGPDFYGCDEYVETTPGSGEEPVETTQPSEKEDDECNVTNEETGEIAKLLCSAVNKTANSVEDLLLLDGNETESENQTIRCSKTEFGCCPDWYTPAEGKNFAGCPEFVLGGCNETKYGCCLDNVTLARGSNLEGCGESNCAGSLFGCCQDRRSIAFGPHYAGCERSSYPCELSTFGCCEDGKTAALSKNGSGCGSDCLLTKWGCCPDGKTTALSVNNEGCGCKYSQYGCCPDGKTSASGSNFAGCPETCAQSHYGCCPDGKTAARGPNREGCPCQYTRWGCCNDGESSALGPNQEGCDDCRRSKWGCCPDGQSKAFGSGFLGCPSTTPASFIIGGTVAPQRIISCNLPNDKGEVCHSGYLLAWFYDTTEGRCSQFWFGGCAGNDNRFRSKEECEAVCVEPPQTGRCYLPKVEGPQRCSNLVARYWYDYTTKQCAAFWWRGCMGNANNFESWESCMGFCRGVGPFEDNEPSVVVTIPPYTPSEHRRIEATAQVQEPAQVWQADDRYTHHRLNLQRQREEELRIQQIREQQRRIEDQRRVEEQHNASQRKQLEDQRQREQQYWKEREYLRSQQLEQQRAAQQHKPGQVQNSSTNTDWNAVCRLAVDSGPCNEYQEAYYFDHFTGQCYNFIFTGCGGNLNRFDSRNQCEQRCGHLVTNTESAGQPSSEVGDPKSTSTPIQLSVTGKSAEVCNLPKDVGRCTGHFNRYYYDSSSGTCELFQYSGCGGNQNRFNSREACSDVCLRTVSQPRIPLVNPAEVGQPAPPKTGQENRCEGPKEHGVCSNYVLKWWFNKEDGTCTKFYYGGCGGNNNLHDTEQECKNACANYIDACQLPAVKGPCEGFRKRWYFNKDKRECEEFVFGGCLGNENSFPSKEVCEQRCSSQYAALNTIELPEHFPKRRVVRLNKDSIESNTVDQTQSKPVNPLQKAVYVENPDHQEVTVKSAHQVGHALKSDNDEFEIVPEEVSMHPQTRTSIPELCLLPEDAGNCHSNMLRYSYNHEKHECVSFNYTGCGGNHNLFASVEACDRACGRFRLQDVCNQDPEPGNCQLRVPKWYYDRDSNRCKVFMWSGCGVGNGNRFTSSEECNNLCQVETKDSKNEDPCFLEPNSGPCQDATTMWYFDAGFGDCRKFTYGGCRGNENRFASKNECSRHCSSRSAHVKVQKEPRVICSLPFDAGSCSGIEKKWFFDMNTGRCRSFTFGGKPIELEITATLTGCEGNENRFEDELSCFSACKQFANLNHLEHRSRPRVQASQRGAYTAGSLIELRCIYEAADVHVVWFHNETKLTSNNVDRRYSSVGQLLKINASKPNDSGKYSCSSGQVGVLSEPLDVVVKALPKDVCVDHGSESTCTLVKHNNLCSHVRYGRFCCQTCSV